MEQVLAISDETHQKTQIFDLGTPIVEYISRKSQPIVTIIVYLTIAGISVGVFFLFNFLLTTSQLDLILYPTDIFFFWMQQAVYWLIKIMSFLFLFVPVMCLMQIIYLTRAGQRHYYICTDGLIITNNLHTQTVSWSQIISIRYQTVNSRSSTAYYQIKRNNGRDIKLTNDVGTQVETVYVETMVPKLLVSYDRGEIIPFGRFILNSTGVQFNDRGLLWSQIETIHTAHNAGRLSIFQSGQRKPWATIKAADLLTFTLVEQLLKHILNKQRAQANT